MVLLGIVSGGLLPLFYAATAYVKRWRLQQGAASLAASPAPAIAALGRAQSRAPLPDRVIDHHGTMMPIAQLVQQIQAAPSQNNFLCYFTEKLWTGRNLADEQEAHQAERQYYARYDNRHDGYHPYCSHEVNALADYYLRPLTVDPQIDERNGMLVDDKISYLYGSLVSDDPLEFEALVADTLSGERNIHWQRRPEKLIIDFSLIDNGVAHKAFMIVEPVAHGITMEPDTLDLDLLSTARITVFNTHGDSIDSYREFEEAAMRAAQRIYNSASTTICRNTKKLWVGHGTCGSDALEYMLQLAASPNAQQMVMRGLPPRSASDNVRDRQRHGRDLIAYYQDVIDGAF